MAVPSGIAMMMKSFGLDPEALQNSVGDVQRVIGEIAAALKNIREAQLRIEADLIIMKTQLEEVRHGVYGQNREGRGNGVGGAGRDFGPTGGVGATGAADHAGENLSGQVGAGTRAVIYDPERGYVPIGA
jgi:hypothetical protein